MFFRTIRKRSSSSLLENTFQTFYVSTWSRTCAIQYMLIANDRTLFESGKIDILDWFHRISSLTRLEIEWQRGEKMGVMEARLNSKWRREKEKGRGMEGLAITLHCARRISRTSDSPARRLCVTRWWCARVH